MMDLDISPDGGRGVTTVEGVEHFEVTERGVYVETADGAMTWVDHELYGGSA